MKTVKSSLVLFLVLSFSLQFCAAQNGNNSRDALLQAKMRFLGANVLPFNLQKQNAVISGISNVLQDGITASDISLKVLQTYNSTTAYGSRRLLSVASRQLLQSSFPAVDVELNITTSAGKAQNESATLVSASNQTYSLASSIGSQGLQTQQIVVQSTKIDNSLPPSPPPPQATSSPPPPPPPTESPEANPPAAVVVSGGNISQSPPPPPPPTASAPSPSAMALGSGNSASASGNSASGSSSSGSSFSTGGIVGVAVGGFIILAVIAAIFIWRRRRMHSKSKEQAHVTDYYYGMANGKSTTNGPSSGPSGPIIADSRRPGSSSLPTSPLPAPASGRTDEKALRTDEKAEYYEPGEKTEVQPVDGQSQFMNVKL